MLSTTISEECAVSLRRWSNNLDFIPFDEFVSWALYDKEIGYYQQRKTRVGKSPQADFFTSTSFRKIWLELVIESCTRLLFPESPASYHFVEIAAEPGESILSNGSHPFKSSNVIRLGNEFEIPSQAIVYSNEWLDSQPFKRFSYSSEKQGWQEHGVYLEDINLYEVKSTLAVDSKVLPFQSIPSSDGYVVDWPTQARESLSKLLSQSGWKGLFLTFDYGLTREELLTLRPFGTARTYYKHNLGTELLNQPGSQDITCHLCWDEIIETMESFGFAKIKLSSQESFMMNYASKVIKNCVNSGNTKEINQIKELIHPQYMGLKFQSLYGIRE
jgi:SAM-dependent MidA family methyltransferase